jgi:hypothetical protein
MLLATTTQTDVINAGLVSSSLISDVSPLIYIILGIIFGFFILETLINAVRKKE